MGGSMRNLVHKKTAVKTGLVGVGSGFLPETFTESTYRFIKDIKITISISIHADIARTIS